MPPPIDPSQDYLLIIDPQTIYYYYQVTEGAYNPPAGAKVNYAERFAVDRQTMLSDAKLWRNGAVFRIFKIPYEQAGLLDPPKPMDKLVDRDGITWIVEQESTVSLGWEFRLTCTRKIE